MLFSAAASIPEPATLGLFGSASLGLAAAQGAVEHSHRVIAGVLSAPSAAGGISAPYSHGARGGGCLSPSRTSSRSSGTALPFTLFAICTMVRLTVSMSAAASFPLHKFEQRDRA